MFIITAKKWFQKSCGNTHLMLFIGLIIIQLMLGLTAIKI